MTTNWRPTATIETLKQRARIIQNIRAFFNVREVLEVQVPAITQSGITDVNIDSLTVNLGSSIAYLHTSPEYPMKRLLAAGMPDCYFLGSVFRSAECGANHNPEFTMLEWYRLGFTMFDLIDEVLDLITLFLPHESSEVNLLSYADAFLHALEVDVNTLEIEDIQAILRVNKIDYPDLILKDEYLDLLMSLVVIPKLTSKTDLDKPSILVIHSYPLSQAALAKENTVNPDYRTAARFEVIVNGLEIANGYEECLDADALKQRFIEDNNKRISLNKKEMPIDTKFLAAHEYELPACSGVALGIDRLCMLAMDKTHINDVIGFPIEHC